MRVAARRRSRPAEIGAALALAVLVEATALPAATAYIPRDGLVGEWLFNGNAGIRFIKPSKARIYPVLDKNGGSFVLMAAFINNQYILPQVIKFRQRGINSPVIGLRAFQTDTGTAALPYGMMKTGPIALV